MIRRILASLLVTALALAVVARADNPVNIKVDPKKSGQKDEAKLDERAVIEEAAIKQARLSQQFREFEGALLRLAQRLESSSKAEDREKAVVLKKAIDKAMNEGVDTKFDRLVSVLKTSKAITPDYLEDAMARNKELADDIRTILAILLTDNRDEELRKEEERLRELIRRLNEIIRTQQVVRTLTDRDSMDKDRLAREQNRVSNATEGLARSLGKGDAKDGKERKGEAKGEGKKGSLGKGEAKEDTKESKGDSKSRQGAEAGRRGDKENKGSAKDGEGTDKENKAGAKDGDGNDKENKGGAKDSPGGDKENKGGAKDGEGSDKESKGGAKDGQGDDKENKGGKAGAKENGEPAEAKPAGGDENDKAGGKDSPKAGDARPGEGKQAGKQDGKGAAKADSKGRSEGKGQSKGAQAKGGQQQSGSQQGNQQQSGDQQQQNQQGQAKGSQQGGQQQGQSKGDGQQGGQQQQQQAEDQPPDQTPGRKQIEDANQDQRRAEGNIDKDKRADAGKDQDQAIEKLIQARKRWEELLRQLREEEIERLLSQLQARCERMLAMQIEVKDGTVATARAIDANADKKPSRTEVQKSLQLADREDEIVREASKAITLLETEGSAVAFPEVFIQIRSDMENVSRRLRATDVDAFTQTIEQDIIDTLKEMVEALKKAQKDQQAKKQQQQQQQSGQQQDQRLIDLIAELKMIRSLQIRVNDRTKLYSRVYEGKEQAPVPEPNMAPDEKEKLDRARKEVKDLADRQEKIFEVTENIAKGRNR